MKRFITPLALFCALSFASSFAACTSVQAPTASDYGDDRVPAHIDNCPEHANADQADYDGDGLGDACDGDDDNDGVVDADDCAPRDPTVLGCTQWYADQDGDGFGTPDDNACACFPTAPYTSTNASDCDDTDPNIRPGSVESCDGIDNNCNGVTDGAFQDLDQDGTADCVDSDDDNDGTDDAEDNCPLVHNDGQTNTDGNADGGDACDADDDDDGVLDVDDNCPTVPNPSQIDENKNGAGDACEGDWDGDGVLNEDDNCPWVANPDQVNTDREETEGLGDGQGDACDLDDDDDGTPDTVDCAPLDKTIHPNAVETCGDDVDRDCSGATNDGEGAAGCTLYYRDADNDGYGDNDAAPVCLCEPTGHQKALAAGDCDDKNESIYAGAPEKCNAVDDNCDGTIDESWPMLGTSCDGADADLCQDGAWTCNAAQDGMVCGDGPSTPEAAEICNGADDDCDGVVDNGFPTLGQACDGDDSDQCANGTIVCAADGGVMCGTESVKNIVEICDGKDNDCDGEIDEGCDDDNDGYCDINMTVVGSPAVCPAGGQAQRDCEDADADVHPGATEICNGYDDDCDGLIDETGAWPSNDGDAFDQPIPATQVTDGADTPFPLEKTVSYSGTFYHAGDVDHVRWSSPVAAGKYWMCRVKNLDAGVKVKIVLGYQSHDTHETAWNTVWTSSTVGNLGFAFIWWTQAPGPITLLAGVKAENGVTPCASAYKLQCKWTNDKSAW